MKILITGVNGFIGRNLATSLITEDHDVIGLDCDKTCLHNSIKEYIVGSVLNKKLVFQIIQDVDVVVHLAAITEHTNIVNDKYKTFETNFNGTKNVLEAFQKYRQPSKFIYSSTGKVYGTIKENPITEESQKIPLNILGKSKLITEQLIDFYATENKEFIIFRMFQIYGLNQKKNFLIPTIISQLNNSKSKEKISIVLGDTKAKRDYIYIDDVINAFVKAMEIKLKNGFNTYNICSGIPVSAEDIVLIISKILDTSISIEVNKKLLRTDEMMIEYGSYNKAQKVLGWSPKITLEQGLKKIIEKTCNL